MKQTKLQYLNNYVGLISSKHPRIRRSEGNTLVDPKKVKNIKRENKDKRENTQTLKS